MQRWKVRTPRLRGAVIVPPRRSEPRIARGLGREAAGAAEGGAVARDLALGPLRAAVGAGLAGHPPEAALEGGVAEAVGGDRLGRDRAAGGLGDRASQRLGGGVGEIELDDGAGDVPGDVLAADEVVGGGVVEGVGLDDRPAGLRGGGAPPFPGCSRPSMRTGTGANRSRPATRRSTSPARSAPASSPPEPALSSAAFTTAIRRSSSGPAPSPSAGNARARKPR